MTMIYFLIALGATIVGSMAGLGGGVIIKPLLDSLGHYNISTIGVLSAFTVFSMAIVSIIQQVRYKFKIEARKTILIGIGSMIGGVIGDKIMVLVLQNLRESLVVTIQNAILAVLLIIVYVYMNNKSKYKSFKVNNFFVCILIGVFLGGISSFLSIGGGPINVCVLTIVFSMNTKEAAVNSIITILFSQGAKIVSIVTSTGLGAFDLRMLPFMIVGGILGGFIGSKFNKSLKSEMILKVFNVVVILLIILNLYNIVL